MTVRLVIQRLDTNADAARWTDVALVDDKPFALDLYEHLHRKGYDGVRVVERREAVLIGGGCAQFESPRGEGDGG